MRVIIKGEPVGKGRPRFTKSGRAYTPSKTSQYESYVKQCYKIQNGNVRYAEDVPLSIQIVAFMKIPKSVSKKKRQLMLDGLIQPTKKPDIDNVVKIILDALNGVAYYDDKQIVQIKVAKTYSEVPQVWVMINESTEILR